MKGIIPIFIIFALIFSSCATLIPVNSEKLEIVEGGKLRCEVYSTKFELRVDDEIVREQDDTYTNLYLYEKDEKWFWKVIRNENETEVSFFPQTIHFKVDNIRSEEDSGMYAYYGNDVNTGKRYHVIHFPWKSNGGYFYFVGNEEKQIIYSVRIHDIDWK